MSNSVLHLNTLNPRALNRKQKRGSKRGGVEGNRGTGLTPPSITVEYTYESCQLCSAPAAGKLMAATETHPSILEKDPLNKMSDAMVEG